ncbi:bifunctional sugar phosphate isomerase/epimerase/4-hydroxyphenylpyruvate dioxygenase family protein [Pantoea stewartii]|uniref:3-dehydroshikimate dehydratase n=1 Tax=Pantoea stewartii TaxID=66269 RepID=A0AB34VJC2_9GAMM|nr:sugar phosphate isomerase/epimerase and 4-hydroxyphenylpyruvate domain-containing protein [Pantoea stewartii]KTS70827.1 4-hydroxyphenylpyruvate dioxygenase [Pantoea stewartii]KTT00179.1 4-hydroxyphenylpyruvate dioxygenase [Pantoea stewartii]KTT06485.1 4-hydroxyphenylpyruvate dioxygenase [Pantoea stewartii]
MKRSVATVSVSGTLPEKLRAIAAAGFDGVEIFDNDLVYYPGSPVEIRQLCEELGLEILLFQPFRDFEGGPRDRLAKNLARAARKFEVMTQLGCQRMLVCSNVSPDCSDDFNTQVSDLRALAELAAQYGITLGYEALAWGRHVSLWRDAWARVEAVDHPSFGIVLDSFHILSRGDSLDGLDIVPPEKIVFVQLADAPLLKMDVLSWSRHFRCFPGQGELNLTQFMTQLSAHGYRDAWSLEIFNDGFRASPVVPTAQDGYRSLLWLEEQTRDWLVRQPLLPSALASLAGEELFHSAPQPPLMALEFIEFAVSHNDALALGQWLTQLGLVHAGEHRSKQVSLYRNGKVNVILNAQPDSQASGYYHQHGISLCAVAWRVRGVENLIQRAQDYGYAIWQGETGPNERQIPALCAPDGSLIYLVEDEPAGQDGYHSDFNLTHRSAPQPAMQTLDHLAIALPDETRDNWIMFLRSVPGFVQDTEWELPDPLGLVRSRVLRSPNDAIRLPLNMSVSRETQIARALTTYQGAGLQHVAFGCDDLFSAVKAARERGLKTLRIPANYYQDLLARFDLDPDFLAQLQRFDVMYDRDEQGGELLHVYTEPYEKGRFFFELLERRRRYHGFGAANAPVRLTAMR